MNKQSALVKENSLSNKMSYFDDVNYRGKLFYFQHLEPFTMDVESQRNNKTFRVRVIYTNHCFSKGLEKNRNDFQEGDPVFDKHTKRPRIFCPERYSLSSLLEGIIRSLIGRMVFQTASERNWCFVTEVLVEHDRYHVFFELRRASDASRRMQDLELYVESAYLLEDVKLLGRMRFELLCSKVYNGEKTRTKR